MRRPLTTTEYVLSAFFALVAAFPLATAADGKWVSIQPLASHSHEHAEIVDGAHYTAPSMLRGILGADGR